MMIDFQLRQLISLWVIWYPDTAIGATYLYLHTQSAGNWIFTNRIFDLRRFPRDHPIASNADDFCLRASLGEQE